MPRKPVFYEAVTVYENGVRALQRHDFLTAAEAFRTVVQRFPEERELLERSQLYLRVCEREALQRPAGPQTAGERIYAATLALNAGDSETALGHLNRALDQEPNSDHAHYVLALTFLSRSQHEKALQHLRRAIELNPENRALARQDPDLRIVRDLDGFRTILEARPTIPKRPPVRSRKFEVRRKR